MHFLFNFKPINPFQCYTLGLYSLHQTHQGRSENQKEVYIVREMCEYTVPVHPETRWVFPADATHAVIRSHSRLFLLTAKAKRPCLVVSFLPDFAEAGQCE